jgi:hypothetical protein
MLERRIYLLYVTWYAEDKFPERTDLRGIFATKDLAVQAYEGVLMNHSEYVKKAVVIENLLRGEFKDDT